MAEVRSEVTDRSAAVEEAASSAEEIPMLVDETAENATGILAEARAIDGAVCDQTVAVRGANGRVDTIGDVVDADEPERR